MGFYLELRPSKMDSVPKEFVEQAPPATYWGLYGIAVFAIICMALAAYQVLHGLAIQGSGFDWFLFLILFLLVLGFLVVGFKMAFLRKFLRIEKGRLELGYYCFGFPWVFNRWTPSETNQVELFNYQPAPNLAPQHHNDPQYYIRGHWRILLKCSQEKSKILDKHVEREALEPLLSWVQNWKDSKKP